MNLGDLLTYLRGSILNDRSDRIAGSSDYLWEDETLIVHINEAHRRFARRSLALRDGTTPSVTEVTLVAGQTLYELHPAITAVISARYMDGQTDLARVGHSLLGAYRAPTETWVDPAGYYGLPSGAVLAFSTDEELSVDAEGSTASVTLRVYPEPNAQQDGRKIKLRVVRNPLVKFTPDNLDAVPEIAEDHHIDMLDWAAYLSLRIVDDDAGAPRRAQEFAQSFEVHVKEARNLAMRKMFTPQQWGFGRGGFAWSS